MADFQSKYSGEQVEALLDSVAKGEAGGGGGGSCENLTYDEFVSKVNNSELVEGCLYRITDYETVVTGDSLTTASNHGFDLIVLATSSNSYSNKCWATPTDRYQYSPYPNCQLGKWQIWWSHERTNQIWVPETGHKGVIYRMIDEWGNDCPYDFKSIMFKVPDIASDVNGTLGTVESLADDYFPTFTIIIDSEIQDASVYLNSFEDDSTFCKNNVIKSSIVDIYNEEASSPFPYVMFLASCGDTYSDLSSKKIYNNVIGESTTGVLFFAECNYFNFSNNSIGKNSSNIRLIARQDDLQNNGTILNNNFKDNITAICLEASDISNNFIDSDSYDIRMPITENIPRTPYQGIEGLRIGKNVGLIRTDFGPEKQEYVYLSGLHIGDSSYDIHFTSSYGTPVDGFYTNIGKDCHVLHIELTYSPTVNIGDKCADITVNGICTIGDGCSAIEYSSETGASQLRFNSGVHNLIINPLDDIKATVIAGSPTGSADDIVDQTVTKPENGPDNADYLLYVNGQNRWVAEPIMSLDKTVKYTEASLRTIKVDLLNDGMVYALPLGSEEAKAEADCVLQEKIDDLEEIRQGAAKGATALQSVPSEYVTDTELSNKGYATTAMLEDKVDKVSGKGLSTEDFTTELKDKLEGLSNYDDSELREAIDGKQDTLVSGTTLKTVNGQSLLGEGNITIEGGGGGGTGDYYTKEEEDAFRESILDEEGYLYSNGEKVDMRFTRSLLPVGTQIPASANLNTKAYLKIGKYYCSLNVDAKTITNCPTSEAFSMEVFNPLGTNVDDEDTRDYTYRIRVLTDYKTGMQYIQYCATSGTAGVWNYNAWKVVPQTAFTLNSSKNDGTAALGSATQGVYVAASGQLTKMTYTLAKSVPSNAVFTDTNTKVTAVGNHYTPAEDTTSQIDAPEGEVVIGLKRDAAGHVVGVVSAAMSGGGGIAVETDPIFSASAAAGITTEHIAEWSGKQDKLVSGTNIKTINGTSILGEGDIAIKSGSKEYIIYDEQNNFPNEIIFSEVANIIWHPNKVYVANTLISTCAIYSEGIQAPTDIVGEYSIMFKTSSEDELMSFSFPENWLWANGQTPVIKGDTHYELSVVASKLGEDYVYKAVLTPFTNIN